MNASLILNVLGRLIGLFACAGAVFAVWAFAEDSYTQASLFIFTFMVSLVLSAVLIIATQERDVEKAKTQDLVVFLLASWSLISVVGSIPFLTIVDGRPIGALFEAVSSLTTTGVTRITSDINLPVSLLGWKILLHLYGAILTLSGILLLLSRLNQHTRGLRYIKSIGIGKVLKMETFLRLFLLVSIVPVSLFLIGWSVLVIDGVSSENAAAFAASAATTGLVTQGSAELFSTHTLSVWILSGILICASVNIGILLTLTRSPLNIQIDNETRSYLLVLAMAVGLFVLQSGGDIEQAAKAISTVSTSGLFFGEYDLHQIGVPLAIFFGFIGGTSNSTSGGMKVFRLRLLFARSQHEFTRLAVPHSVVKFEIEGVRSPVDTMMSVWVYLIGFAAIAMGLGVFLAILGNDFEAALTASMGAVTSAGYLISQETINSLSHPLSQLVFLGSMILGRLELLLILAFLFRD